MLHFQATLHVSQPSDLTGRIKASILLAEQVPLQKQSNNVLTVVDDVDNCTANAYGARPERLYIIQNDRIVLQGGTGPFGYNIDEIRDFLQNHSRRDTSESDY